MEENAPEFDIKLADFEGIRSAEVLREMSDIQKRAANAYLAMHEQFSIATYLTTSDYDELIVTRFKKPTLRSRITLGIFNLRYRLSRWISPYEEDDED